MIYSIKFHASESQTLDELKSICRIVNTFINSLQLGFFGVAANITQSEPEYNLDSDLKSDVLIQSFEAESLNHSCFLVLVGMLVAWQENSHIKNVSIEIFVDRQQISIDKLSLSDFYFPKNRQISIIKPNILDLQDPFILFISFSFSLNKFQQDFLHRGLKTWEHLLVGGLPANGYALGKSMIGRTIGYFSEPDVYHYAVEGISAHPICLDLLLNFLEESKDILAVQSIEIQ